MFTAYTRMIGSIMNRWYSFQNCCFND